MSNESIAILIITVCVILFITNKVNTCVAAAMGCVAFVVTGVCSYEEAFSGFSNSLVVLIFGALIVGEAMSQTGLDRIIGRFVIKISRNNERIFILLAGAVSGLLSMWMANTAVVACFLPIIASVSHTSKNMTMKNMTMSITFGAMFGGACTLIGSTSQLAVQGIMTEMTTESLGMFTLMPVGLILLAAYLLYIQLFGYKLGIRIWGGRPLEGIEDEALLEKNQEEVPHDKRKLITLVVIFTLMVISYTASLLPTQITAISAALLCFLTGCASPKKTIRRINWNSVLFLGCCMGLANGIMATDINVMVSDLLTKVLGANVNPYMFLAVVILFAMVVSNFLANATTTVIFAPIVISACETYGFRVLPFCLALAYAASTTCATPMAHSQITMTMVAGYRFTDYVKANIPVQILTFVLLMIFIPLFFPLV
ncbi:MAG: SLC13/DASS family transporter [Lachnospiraceae bacterium]|nr:SLC13/DASS family transporter [Lachnospiraceae bacterium]